MATRRKPRGPETQLAFEALAIEGGLLSADWLSRVAQQKAGTQSDAEYRVPKGINLRDDIGRYWRIAQAHWGDFAKGRAAKAEPRALAGAFVPTFLRECFGFASLEKVAPILIKDRTYPVSAMALDGRVPVVIAAAGLGLDAPSSALGDGTRKRSAFGLAQELLNASDHALWGIASDGLTLRILRDNASLTRPAWIEADLARIFAEERFADFAALWLLAHETRFGAKDRPPQDCALETWRNAGREEGTRAREDLRRGVEDALLALGNGFLAHAENTKVRGALENGTLSKEAFFQELLRLVYRLIFLLTAEERDVLHDPSATEHAKSLFAQGYGTRRLRDRSARRNAYDRFGDLWESLKIVLRGLSRGETRLGLPALGGLFDEDQCPTIGAAKLENRALLLAVFRLSWLREDGSLSRVNWRDMGPEELGSVYESLLELVPVVSEGGRKLGFATGDETKGNARKTTGSYYTPDSLVQVLLDSALEPVVEETIAKNPGDAARALLDLSIVDPACGSGHFLLSAARRLAAHVARLDANGTPSAEQYRHALRQVVGRCIFGVDLNPMAVELCKVSLWMEAVEPGRPLSFLDSHIQHGNALLGATPELLANGIPDAAWEPIEGDDNKIANALKKQNTRERVEASLNLASPPASTYARLGAGACAVDDATDESLDAVEKKEKEWRDLLASAAYAHQLFIADLWCAAFVWPKEAAPLRELAPTESTFRAVQKEAGRASRLLRKEVERLRAQYNFFHWHLGFPQVMAKGGFDLVLGNPPWEKINFKDEEFFSSSHPEIANARTKAVRKRLLEKLGSDDPLAHARYESERAQHLRTSNFFRFSGYFPLTGVSRINLYSVFCEIGIRLLAERGRLGMVLASGIVTDDNNKALFSALVNEQRLMHAWDFENREGVFSAVHRSFKFCLFAAGGPKANIQIADFAFYLGSVDDLASPDAHFSLTREELLLLNPVSRTCPTFRTMRDADISKRIYRRIPTWASQPKTAVWPGTPKTPFNMSNDSGLFIELRARGQRPAEDGELRQLYESKYIHQFNHRFASSGASRESEAAVDFAAEGLLDPDALVQTRYWVSRAALADRFPGRWFLAYRKIARATDERTSIVAVLPEAACGDSLIILEGLDAARAALLAAVLNSHVYDYCARQKVAGTNFNHWIWHQLPVPSAVQTEAVGPWSPQISLRDWVVPLLLELTFTAWDLEPFARELGYGGPPFRWDPERRFLLRCELDAAFFHLYGLSRDDTDYVMETFPIVRKNDEKAHDGKFRTKNTILEIYDDLAEAARTGKQYATRLDPPPADPRVGHPARHLGKIISLAVRRQPDVTPAAAAVVVPDLAAVGMNEWARPHTMERGEIQAAILAVLKAYGAPMDRRQARLAALLCLEPHLLTTQLDKTERGHWARVVGGDAKKAASASIDGTLQEWGAALTGLRGRERLIENLDEDTWMLGMGADAIDTSGWPDGRASLVVNVLRRLHASTQVDAIILKLPTNVRQWLDHAA